VSPKAWRLVVDETDAAWRLISHYLLLIDFTKHLLQALQLGAEALGRERIPARPSQLRRHSKIWIASSTRSFGWGMLSRPANVTLAVLVPGN